MQARTLVLVAAAAACALLVRHARSSSRPTPPPTAPAAARDTRGLAHVLRGVEPRRPAVVRPAQDPAGDPDEPAAGEPPAEDVRAARTARRRQRYDELLANLRPGSAIYGDVRDLGTDEPIAGATVVVGVRGADTLRVAITDDDGFYVVDELAPGTYDVSFYHEHAESNHPDIVVGEAGVQLEEQLLRFSSAGVAIDDSYTTAIPTGRTFAGALGTAADSQDDPYGVSITGSFTGVESVENTYVIDGELDTELRFGD